MKFETEFSTDPERHCRGYSTRTTFTVVFEKWTVDVSFGSGNASTTRDFQFFLLRFRAPRSGGWTTDVASLQVHPNEPIYNMLKDMMQRKITSVVNDEDIFLMMFLALARHIDGSTLFGLLRNFYANGQADGRSGLQREIRSILDIKSGLFMENA